MKRFVFLAMLIFCIGFVSCVVEDDDSSNQFDDSDNGKSGSDTNDLPDEENRLPDNNEETNDDSEIDQPDDSVDTIDDFDDEPDDIIDEKLQEVSALFAEDTVDAINLSWKNPEMEGFQYVVVSMRMDQYPLDKDDGTVIYQDSGESVTVENAELGETYFFTVFACYGSRGCSEGVKVYAQPCYHHLDIVFSMDVSTTMGFILADLENEIGLVWEFVEENFSEAPRVGLTVFVDDVTVTNDGEAFESQAALKSEFNKWYNHTSTNKQTQSGLSNGDWPENSLDSMAYSARDFDWRDSSDTLRIIIHATDDTFYEYPEKFSNGIAVEYTYDETVDLLVQEKIRVAAFAALLGGKFGNTNVEPGFSSDYNGKESIPDATGGEVYSIKDVKDGNVHMYQAVNDFIENAMCKSYDQK
jgi:hypothetical protein